VPATNLRFIILGDDKGSSAFNRFARSVNDANKAVDRNNAALKQSGKSSVAAQGGFLALTGTITGFSDAMNVGSKHTGLFAKGMAGLSLATGLLEPELAALVVAAGGLAAGFTAAAAGLGVFQVVAQAALSKASQAATKATAAQNAYKASVAGINDQYQRQLKAATNNAQRQAALTTKQTALQAALTTKVKATTAAWQGLAPAQVKLGKAIITLQGQWDKFIARSTPGVSSVVTKGFGLVPRILKLIQPLLPPVEAALRGIIDMIDFGLGSPKLAKFIDMLARNSGPVLIKLAETITGIGKGLGGIITAFMPQSQRMFSAVRNLAVAFGEWGQGLTGHSGFRALIAMFKKDTPVVNQILKNLAITVKNVASSMAAFSSPSNSFGLLNTLRVLSGILAKLSANKTLVNFVLQFLLLKSIAGQVLGPLKIFGGLVGTTGSAIEDITKLGFVPWLKQIKLVTIAQKIWNGVQVAFNIIMRANPIILVGTLLVGLVAAVIYAYKHFKWFRDFVNAVWAGILATVKAVVSWFQHTFVPFFTRTIPHAWSAAWTWIKNAAKAAWDFLTHGWGQFLIPGITLIRKVIEVVRDHWRDAWNAIKTVAVTVWHIIERVVINPLKSIWNWLKNAFNFVKSVGGFLSGGGASGQASPRVAQQYALSQLSSHGWDVTQMVPLTDLWQQESGWSNIARNKSSGAYGIPQALPPSKMGPAANPPQSSYIAQINWGLSYIKGRYGTPAGAWAHERAYNWYGGGGMIREPVMGVGMRSGRGYGLGERGAELVTPAGALERRLDMIASLLGDLIGAVDDNAPRTAAGVARAFGNATRGSDYTALYGAR
jgi:hypothetical protein